MRIQVTDLTDANFKEFGQIITNDGKTPNADNDEFSWWEKLGAIEGIELIDINILKCKQREMKVDKLEIHKQSPEVIIPLGGKEVLVILAPAGELDEKKIKAFKVGNGKGIVLKRGVYHYIPYPTDGDTDCLIIFKRSTGINDLEFKQLSEEYEIVL